MTNILNIDGLEAAPYGVKIGGLPPMDRPQPSAVFRQREKKAKRPKGLYMQERKTLNQWRLLRGLEVVELGELTGAGKSVESYLYRGVTPRVDLALKFARALEVDVGQIIWGRSEKSDMDSLPSMPKSLPFDPRTREPVISEEQLAVMVQWAAAGYNKTEILEAMGVSRQTFYSALAKYEAMHGPVMFANARARSKDAADAVPTGQGAQKARKGAATKAGEEKPTGQRRKAVKAIL